MSRRRHFGNVRKLRSGRYQVRYRGPGGQPRTGDRTFEMKGEALRHLAELELEIHRGTWADPKARSTLLSEYADEWVATRKLAISTGELYESLLRLHIKPQLGSVPVGRVTPSVVRRWHRDRSMATGAVRVGHAYKLLRAILTTAVGDGLLPANPCQIPGAGSPRSPERPFMSREQMEDLAGAMPEGMGVIVVLTFWAHLRLGELLALRREDVDLETGRVFIHRAITRAKGGPVEKTTKTAQSRTVHLPSQAVEALREHMARIGLALPSARLFLHSNGAPLREHHLRAPWRKARESTGMTRYHFHDLRHAGLTYVAQQGVPLKHIQARAGHSTVRAAMIYQHMADGLDADLAKRMSDDPVVPGEEASGS